MPLTRLFRRASGLRARSLARQLALLGLLIVGAGALTGGQWGLPVASASARPAIVRSQSEQTGSHQAALVIRYDDDYITTRCISFTEEQINGEDLLLQSRAIDDTGYVQPTKQDLRKIRGVNSIYHNNGIQTWHLRADGELENVEVS